MARFPGGSGGGRRARHHGRPGGETLGGLAHEPGQRHAEDPARARHLGHELGRPADGGAAARGGEVDVRPVVPQRQAGQQDVAETAVGHELDDPLRRPRATPVQHPHGADAVAVTLPFLDDLGGVVPAIEQGFIQREIERAAYEYGQSVERGDRITVGVNKFQSDAEAPIELLKIDEEVGNAQVRRLSNVKAERDNAEVERRLSAIEDGARGDANLMPLILDAVRAYASVGEICNTLRGVFGEYQETF